MSVDVEITATLNPEGTIRGLLEIEESTADASKNVATLQSKYDSLKKSMDKTNFKADEWNSLNKELKETEKALEKANSELNETAKSSKAATGSISALQSEIEQLTQEISGVAAGSKEFDELSAKIRRLDGELSTANESLIGLSSEDKAGRIGQLAGGLGSVAASAALIGGEDSAISDFFGGIESALGVMIGLQGAIESVAAAKKLLSIISFQSAAANAAESTAIVGQTVATEGATVASWAFNASLLANPVFWIVAVIMAVVAAFAIFTAATKTAGAEHEKLNAQLEKESQLIEANRKSRERANAELVSEIENKQKLIVAEIKLLEATGNRSKEQETRLKQLKKELDGIDEESLDILGDETQKRIAENTKMLHNQIVAAKKGIEAVYDEDWGSPDFDYDQVKKYFDDVDKLQLKASLMYQKANEASTEKEKQEYIKRAQNIEEQVTQKTSRVLAMLEKIKGTLGGDASEEMQKVIDDITKFGDRANESADAMSEFQKSIDGFNTDNMVEEFEREQEAQEELERKREIARGKWKDFIVQQKALREELAISRMSDQERELHDLEIWFNERKKLAEKDSELSAQLQETYAKKKKEIDDKFIEIELTKAHERAEGLKEIENQISEDRAIVESMRLSAAVAMAEQESNAKLDAWQKALDGNRAIADEELNALKTSLANRRDVLITSIEQEADERKKSAENAKIEEIAAAEERIQNLQKNGLDEVEAQKQLSDLKLGIISKYNAEVLSADSQAAIDKQNAQKQYDDAELQATIDQKNKLLELNQIHNEHLIDGLQKISSALDESVGQFEGALGKLAGAVSSGIGNLGTAIQGFSNQLKELKAKTAEGVTLTPEEQQALSESTAQSVSAIVGAAGAVAQGIVDSITESNRAKAEQALNDLESNKQRELDIIQQNLDAGTVSQEAAEKQRQAVEFKAAQEKYEIEKAQFENEKKAKIASATISGITGAVSAFAGAMQLGPIAGPIVGGILAAAVAGMTVKNVSNIKKTKFGGSPPTPATSGGGGSAGATPTTPVDPSSFLPTGSNSGNEAGANQTGNNGNQNGNNGNITVKAVVVETDVTNTQKHVSAIESRSEFN